MGRTRKEELSGEAKELAKDYDKKIAELQKKKAEALKKINEKTEKLRINMLKQFMTDINENYGVCDEKVLHAITALIKEHKEELDRHIQGENSSLKEVNPRDEGSDAGDVENILRIENNEGSDV